MIAPFRPIMPMWPFAPRDMRAAGPDISTSVWDITSVSVMVSVPPRASFLDPLSGLERAVVEGPGVAASHLMANHELAWELGATVEPANAGAAAAATPDAAISAPTAIQILRSYMVPPIGCTEHGPR